MTQGGYGKIIVFGEHFVVYGLPALVFALPQQTRAHAKIISQPSYVVDQRVFAHPSLVCSPEQLTRFLTALTTFFKISYQLEVTLSGDLVVMSGGVGSSAAAAVATVRALNDTLNLNLDECAVNNAALQAEKLAHGNPSGIDNAAATFGGSFVFEKEKGRTSVVPGTTLHCVLIDSGMRSQTSTVVAAVQNFRATQPHNFERLCRDYSKLFTLGLRACQQGNLTALGMCMNMNQQFLRQLGVSNAHLENIISLTLGAGALGAKITGAGAGGVVVALTKNKQQQHNVATALRSHGYFVTCFTFALPLHNTQQLVAS
ncbi:mevalonate kinase [Candidatus Babeliales bacterium]|nr:mevalonate kinase [Candidatus Babeliales bacterium]